MIATTATFDMTLGKKIVPVYNCTVQAKIVPVYNCTIQQRSRIVRMPKCVVQAKIVPVYNCSVSLSFPLSVSRADDKIFLANSFPFRSSACKRLASPLDSLTKSSG